MSVCVLAAGKTALIAGAAFTLSWTHSVEKTQWEEDWRVMPAGLQIVEARIKGSGAGMDPPEGARLKDGWWIYTPHIEPLERLVLAASGATGSGWRLCAAGGCTVIGGQSGDPAVVTACDSHDR